MAVPISVVVPARDAEATIAGTLDSVFSQTKMPTRTIVIDDASTDQTGGAAAAFAPDVHVVQGEGRGVAAARNMGLRNATTQHVALLDADDRWMPWFIAEAERLVSEHPEVGAVFLSAAVVDEEGRRVGAHPMPDGRVRLEDLLSGRFVPTTSAAVLDRSLALGLGGFDEGFERPSGVEDLDLWFRLAEHAECRSSSRVSAIYVLHERRDRDRGRHQLEALERDRERVIRRLAGCTIDPALMRRASAVMRARSARYWLLAGQSNEARRVARSSLAAKLTLEGIVTLAATYVPPALRERARAVRRRYRARFAACT